MRFIVFLPLMGLSLTGCQWLRDAPKPYPASGAEHPFFETVGGVNIDPESEGASRPGPAAEDFTATQVRAVSAVARIGEVRLPVTLEATPEVSAAAMRNLTENLGVIHVDLKSRPDLKSFCPSAAS